MATIGWVDAGRRLGSQLRSPLTLAVLLGAALRLLWAILLPPQPVVSDQANYLAAAYRLVLHHYFAYGFYSQAPNAQVQPGYPLFLALAVSVDRAHPLWLVHSLQIVLSVATLALTARIARRLLSPWAAVLVVLFFALYVPFLNAPTLVMSETLSLFFWTLAIAAALEGRMVLLGLAAGLGTLVRPVDLAVLPAALVLLPDVRSLLRMAGTFVLAMAPWWVRNLIDFHHFVALSMDSADPLLNGTFRTHSQYLAYLARHHLPYNAFGVAHKEQRLALHRIRKRFDRGLGSFLHFYVVEKVSAVWDRIWLWPDVPHLLPVDWLRELSTVVQSSTWLLAIPGLFFALRGERSALFLALLAAAEWAGTLLVRPQPRYLLPALLPAALLAALLLDRLVHRFTSRRQAERVAIG
jgi:hypothetical protein